MNPFASSRSARLVRSIGPRIDDRRIHGPPGEIVGQHLGAVDVAAEHGGETGGNVTASHDVFTATKCVALDPRPFHGLVEAEQANVGIDGMDIRSPEPDPQISPDTASRSQGNPPTATVVPPAKNSTVRGRSRMWRFSWAASIGYGRTDRSWFPGTSTTGTPTSATSRSGSSACSDQTGRHLAAIQQIAAVDHDVDLATQRRFEGAPRIGEEIRAAPALLNPRPRWEGRNRGGCRRAGGLLITGSVYR